VETYSAITAVVANISTVSIALASITAMCCGGWSSTLCQSLVRYASRMCLGLLLMVDEAWAIMGIFCTDTEQDLMMVSMLLSLAVAFAHRRCPTMHQRCSTMRWRPSASCPQKDSDYFWYV
jgi:hypothetical protein